MAYATIKNMFPTVIVNKIVSFLINPNKEKWAKYWRGESVKFVERVFEYRYSYSSYDILEFIKRRDYSLHSHVDKYYGIYKNIVSEINNLRWINQEYKNTIKKLYSRMFINNNDKRFVRNL